ncbi:MAG: metal ABC transporter substrate-binding protein [Dehalococcoidia bacterium]
MRKKVLLGVLVVVLVGILVAFWARNQDDQPSVDIVGGSVFISNIVQDVADGKLESRPFIPPGMCPGHYDVKPSDIKALANAKAFFVHNYQRNYENVTGLIEAAQNPDLIIRVIDIMGNWMTPPVQADAVDIITQALGEIDEENAEYYQEEAQERVQEILAKGEEVKDRLLDAEIEEIKVICAEMQAGFANWAGFDIVATYGRPEDLSTAEKADLVATAREAGVALVIDNLQSGATATSETMAQDIGAIQVTLSNFPGGFQDTATWEKALDKNIDLLLEALNEWREQYG